MWTWEATIRVSTGIQHVTVQARNVQDAKYLFETIYGKGCIQGNSVRAQRRS
jgi:hypothetical protein